MRWDGIGWDGIGWDGMGLVGLGWLDSLIVLEVGIMGMKCSGRVLISKRSQGGCILPL